MIFIKLNLLFEVIEYERKFVDVNWNGLVTLNE